MTNSLPSVSLRKWYRKVPNEPEESTSTIVLTSPQRFFVDIRLWKEPQPSYYRDETDTTPSANNIHWAFAGTSESFDRDGKRFSQWHHWVDSHSVEPAIDVGEMITQDDGTVLEKGTTIVESTKEEVPYEELWADLPLDTGKNARVCIVLKTLDDNKDVRGMIIRIGGWCQGLVKTDDGMTVERYCPARSGEIMEGDTWDAHVKIGHTELPCKEVLDVEDFTEGHLKMKRGGISWKTVEFFTW